MCPRHGTCGLMKLTFGISETQYVSDCGLTYNGRVLTNNEVNLCRGGPLSTWMGDVSGFSSHLHVYVGM